MPPRWLPVGVARGPRLVGLVAAVLLVAALVITGRVQSWAPPPPPAPPDRTDAAAAPYRIGSSFRCPLARPVLVMSSGHSYPPGHPAPALQGATAVACYQSVEQASTAGYLQAPLPAGTDELFGVYLVPTGSQLQRQCQRAADRLGFAVPCPGLLPTRSPGSAPPRVCDRRHEYEVDGCGKGLPFVLEWEGFAVPPGYIGVGKQPLGHLIIAATKGTPRFPLACPGERTVATVKVRRMPARLLRCPSNASGYSLHGGGVLLRWSQRDLVVMVSLQGWTPLNERLVQTLAAHLQFMPPASA
jgi:hypothetical protein